MNIIRKLQAIYLTHFSQPVVDRVLFRLLKRRPIRSVVEVGLGDHLRTIRLLDAAELLQGKKIDQYVLLDEFDARAVPNLSLKQAHQVFSRRAVGLRLIPGDPAMSICRCANTLLSNNLMIIRGCVAIDSLTPAWTYVPRMLSDQSVVLIEGAPSPSTPNGAYRELTPEEIRGLSRKPTLHRRAA